LVYLLLTKTFWGKLFRGTFSGGWQDQHQCRGVGPQLPAHAWLALVYTPSQLCTVTYTISLPHLTLGVKVYYWWSRPPPLPPPPTCGEKPVSPVGRGGGERGGDGRGCDPLDRPLYSRAGVPIQIKMKWNLTQDSLIRLTRLHLQFKAGLAYWAVLFTKMLHYVCPYFLPVVFEKKLNYQYERVWVSAD